MSRWRIRDAMPQALSIDNFVDAHNNDPTIELCGKLAIVRSILEAEQGSSICVDRLKHPPTLNFERVADSRHNSFFQLLTENCRREELADRLSRISLVVFNYDRAIEHFLHFSLQNYYGMSQVNAAEVLQSLKIFHPYGAVGALPWQGLTPAVEYGAEIRPQDLSTLADGIRTFSEGTDPDSSEIDDLREAIRIAERIVFLGFAYHPQNMELLDPGSGSSCERIKSFGSAMGTSSHDVGIIEDDILRLVSGAHAEIILINDLTCGQLVSEFWRGLALR